MLQDLNTTIKKLEERREEIQNRNTFIPRVYETMVKYVPEVVRDLEQADWRSQFQGGLNAGYILCVMGDLDRGLEFLEKSMQMHEANMEKYNEPRSSVLQFIVDALEESCARQAIINQYKTRLNETKEQEADNPEKLRKKIVHIEADLECETGNLNEIYARGRREQGLLYQKLREHGKAIEHFQKSIEEDRRDWNRETTLPNKLSIIDSYLVLGDTASAVNEFMALMKILIPDELKLGDQIPDSFTKHFSKFYPYFEKLGIEDNLEAVARYAQARFENLKSLIKPPTKKEDPKEHGKRSEICELAEIIALYHVGKEEYQQASDIFDEGRELLQYKHHLSRREQAEFAIRAGNQEKARQLIREDEADKNHCVSDGNTTLDLVNLYLQLGDIGTALDRLDDDCEYHKSSLSSGSYSDIFETRQLQIAMLKAVIGKDYAQKTREYAKGKANLFPKKELKFLPEQTKDKKD